MSNKATYRIQMVVDLDFLQMIDEWRRKQPKIPNRTQAFKALAEIGISASKVPDTSETR